MKTEFIQLLVTVPDRETADLLARHLVFESRLAACAQVGREIESYYTWQGRDCQSTEYVLTIKTVAALFEAVEQKIKALHPYEVPQIIAVPLVRLSLDYQAWYESLLPKT